MENASMLFAFVTKAGKKKIVAKVRYDADTLNLVTYCTLYCMVFIS